MKFLISFLVLSSIFIFNAFADQNMEDTKGKIRISCNYPMKDINNDAMQDFNATCSSEQ
ncbi:hypothetical protein [Campylobacter sp. TTU_617]|uniref:hypothetical protein n=1 Tax=Campylobacter sp. TTU_617 TaxID=2768148 RepID=UPI0019048D98|nr:hypothetical protein [Campylobacter sp. TTU_617]MBK1971220.1 hypothetical protein [Campylobacter sp. TTU_617]